MDNSTFDFDQACILAQIQVTNNTDKLLIKTVFNPLNKSSLGTLFFLISGVALGLITLINSNDYSSMILGSILGFGIAIIAFLVVLSQLTDYVQLSGNSLELRHRLKLIKEELTLNHKVKMKTSVEHVQRKSQPGSDSYFRIVELYISNGTDEHLILDYQLDEKNSIIANQLGNEISRIVKERIKSL